MKKLLLLTIALVAVSATAALAAAPGVNLSWANCATTAASGNKAIPCDGAFGAPLQIQGTFRPNFNITYTVAGTGFAGCSSVLDIGFNAPVPDYWKMQSGECNALAVLSTVNPAQTLPCAAAAIFDPTYSGGGYAASYPTPTRIRFRIDWATGAPTPPSIATGQLYPAFKMQFDPDNGVNAGCAGCSMPACLVVNSIEVFGFLATDDYVITAQDVRQFANWQGGAIGGNGCPAETPSENKTWGSVKALYR
jgi:hypothetical protein